jgi:hypothetical protein
MTVGRSPGSTESIRVGFDAQIFDMQRHGGISRYFLQLQAALTSVTDVDARVVRPIRRRRLGAFYANMLVAKASHPDVWHSTFYDDR